MPATYTHPGIYIEEVPSGVHPIAGVSTAETAFVDFFARGPVNEARRVTSLGDFERIFGGLDTRSEGSYAIQQYYLNGGQIAWVVRIDAGNADPSKLTLHGEDPAKESLVISASSPGEWGNRVEVAVVKRAGEPDRFDLFVREVTAVDPDPNKRASESVIQTEEFRNLSMDSTDPRFVEHEVSQRSSLVTVKKAAGTSPIPATVDPENGGAPAGAFQPLKDGIPATFTSSSAAFRTALIEGLDALTRIDPYIFNILCLPASAKLTDPKPLLDTALQLCIDHRAFLIVDAPADEDDVVDWKTTNAPAGGNGALYFPALAMSDPLNEGRSRPVGASGAMAGLYARTDAARGVWKAPAGTEASIRGATVTTLLNDDQQGALNPMGVNVIRNLPIFGNVAWGARTLDGADQRASEWKYIPVRRTALFLEESLRQGLQWVVFEPNDEPLWSQIRLNVGAFMQTLFRQGAFQGTTPREAYFVKCDKETTTQADIDRGVVNILVGFAPLKPAEFVVIRIQQMAGQTQS